MIAQVLLSLCSLERCVLRKGPSYLLSWFFLCSLWISNACVLSTHRYSHERSGVTGMAIGLLNINSKYIFSCLLVSYTHGYYSVSHGLIGLISFFPQILAPGNNWFGTFFSFISFCRHSNFHLSQDLYYWSLMVHFTLENASIPIPIGLTLVCWPIWELASS